MDRQNHRAIWRWLSGIFAAPLDAEALAACRANVRFAAELSQDPALVDGRRMMQGALDALPDGAEATRILERSYFLLFSGAGGPATAAPYESVFTPRGGRLFGESEARMRTLLRHLGLHVAAGPGEPADHVAIECAVMAELPAGAPLRADLTRHLDGWLPDFRDACGEFDASRFYAGAAMIAAALARQELADTPLQ